MTEVRTPSQHYATVLAGALAQVYVLGAALDDGIEWQDTALRAMWVVLGPSFQDGSTEWSEIQEQIQDIMGPDWAPSGKWAEAIDSLG